MFPRVAATAPLSLTFPDSVAIPISFDNDIFQLDEFDIPAMEPWDGILRAAVPKRRNSHARGRKRQRSWVLKNKQNITSCAVCGAPRLIHHICTSCERQIKKNRREERHSAAAEISIVGDKKKL